MSSEINMTNVQATHNIGSQGLIQILYGSISCFNNVTFKYNGRSYTFLLESLEPIIDVEVNSIATIINSLFSGNTAGNRGSLYSARNSSITISDTYFQNSTKSESTVAYVISNSQCHFINCTFTDNDQSAAILVYVTENGRVHFQSCISIRNSRLVMASDKSSVLIEYSQIRDHRISAFPMLQISDGCFVTIRNT